MANSKTGSEPPEDGSPNDRDSGDESSGDESEVLEESPCQRWQKRREEVRLRFTCFGNNPAAGFCVLLFYIFLCHKSILITKDQRFCPAQ